MIIMTDQLKEKMARELCSSRGVDPDRKIGHGAEPNEYGVAPAIMLYSPAWKLVLKEVETHVTLFNAMYAMCKLEGPDQ